MHDLVIRGGTVVDGTGATGPDGRRRHRRRHDHRGGTGHGSVRHEVDADGLVVTPGFVDIHTHFDGQVTWDDDLTPSCWHGVTTAVLGNCGVGFAPVRPGGETALIELMEGVEDIPGTALSEGIRWGWESFAEYLDALGVPPPRPRRRDPHPARRRPGLRDGRAGPRRRHRRRPRADVRRSCVPASRPVPSGSPPGGPPGTATPGGNRCPARSLPRTSSPPSSAPWTTSVPACSRSCPPGVGGEITGDAAGAMEHELEWLVRLGESTRRPITFLVMERPEVDHWRPWFEARPPGQRPGREPAPPGRQPVLRRADGPPVEAQPVPVPAHLPRPPRPPAAARTRPADAGPAGPGPDPGRGARLQRPVPHGPDRPADPRPRLRPRRRASTTSRGPRRASAPSRVAGASTPGRWPTTSCWRRTGTSCCCGRS